MYWGIDLGGTKIELAIVSVSSDARVRVIYRQRIATEANKGYQHILQQIKILFLQAVGQGHAKPDRIGFGTPGVLDPTTQRLKNSNTTCLNGQPLKKDLASTLGLPIVIANDANCFALAEAKLGIVKQVCPEASVVFGIIMGTGVGAGIVVNEQVIYGRHGIAGEWGHNLLDPDGKPCYCGKVGCVETVLSGPALEKHYHHLTGTQKDLKSIYTDYKEKNDECATIVIDRLATYFGIALANVVNIIDPDVIVVGGGVGNIDELYSQGINKIKPYVFNDKLETQILKPSLGDSAGVFGAAMLTA